MSPGKHVLYGLHILQAKRTIGREVQGLIAVSPAKMTETVEMPFGMLSQVGPGNHVGSQERRCGLMSN